MEQQDQQQREQQPQQGLEQQQQQRQQQRQEELNENQQPRKRKRGPTMLVNDQEYNPLNEIEFDNLGQSVGAKQNRFSSWIGVQARTKLSILKKDWHDIDNKDKEQLWLRVKAHFNIEDDTHKKFVLQTANACWRSFKKRLINKYFAKGLDATTVYSYIKEDWEKFKKMKSTTDFLERSRKNRENALKNKNPSRVGPRGYRGKKDDWEKETEDEELKELLDGIQDDRARDWVHGRIITDENGSKGLSNNIKPIVDEIIKYDRQQREGTWIPPPGVDPIIQVLGKERSGRTRGVGSLVGLKKGLKGLGKEKRNKRKKDEEFEELKSTVQHMQRKIDQLESGKNSNFRDGSPSHISVPQPQFDPSNVLENPLPCFLLLPYGKKTRCARGMVFPFGDGLIHGIPLEGDHMRVSVDIVYSKYKELPLPVEHAEMHVLQDARLSIIQWPRDAIVLVKDFKDDTNQDESPDIPSSAKSPPILPKADTKKSPPMPISENVKQPTQPPLMLPKADTKKSSPMPISENMKQPTQPPLMLPKADTKKSPPMSISENVKQPTQPPLMLPKADTKKMSFAVPKKWLSNAGIIKDKSSNVKQFFKRLIDRPEAAGPVHIVADPGIFEGQSYEFNIEVDDMIRLISQRWIDISIIAWFEIMLHSAIQLTSHEGRKTNTAFMNPFAIQEKSCNLDENGVIDYMFRAITHHQDKTLMLAPYWQSGHWVLFVIHCHQRMGFILDSFFRKNDTKPPNYKLTKLVDRAVSRYMYMDESIGSMKWVMVKCNQQVGTWECGYYVMWWLFQFVNRDVEALSKDDFSPLSRKDLDKVVNTWVNKFVAL